MKKTYAAKRLLEHGPLTMSEFRIITGWKGRTAEAALKSLVKSKVAYSIVGDDGWKIYMLAGAE